VKRSGINEIMAQADAMIRHHGFALPPFAYWTPAQFKANQSRAANVAWQICNAVAVCVMPRSC
jgi:D-lyxose ketol-isomerase